MKKAKVVFIGAGSVVFSRNVIADILAHEALKDVELCLVDIDPERLATAEAMARRLRAQLQARARIRVGTNRRRVLAGADFVINAIGVGGFAATQVDLNLPTRHGLKQVIGDTLGVGGIFRALRSMPELLRLCEDMRTLCPDALLINYTNPMAMHCLAVQRATAIRCVGLCHGVQHSAQLLRALTRMLDTPEAIIWDHFHKTMPVRVREWQAWMARGEDPDLSYTCAGINHMAVYLRFESAGKDLYPLVWQAAARPHLARLDPVRFEMCKRLGYYMTETSSHMSEYVPYFLKSPSERARLHQRTSTYLETCRQQERQYQALRRTLRGGGDVIATPYRPSIEYASRIINAVVTDRAYVFNGNVHNRGGALISNLAGDCCVEVPCVVDAQGVRPTAVGALPPACAALMMSNIAVQDLTVRGLLEGRRDYIRQAAMLDPNTAAQLTLPQLDRLLDAMFKAHASRLPATLQ